MASSQSGASKCWCSFALRMVLRADDSLYIGDHMKIGVKSRLAFSVLAITGVASLLPRLTASALDLGIFCGTTVPDRIPMGPCPRPTGVSTAGFRSLIEGLVSLGALGLLATTVRRRRGGFGLLWAKIQTRISLHKCVIGYIGLLVLLAARVSFCQSQRLALRAGSFLIDGGETAVQEAVCLNAARHFPAVDAKLAHLLTSPDSARVQFGNAAPIPLTKAIAERKLEVLGTDSFDLKFRNLTSEQAKIEFSKPPVFAEKAEGIEDFSDLEKILNAHADDPDIQATVWDIEVGRQITAGTPWSELRERFADLVAVSKEQNATEFLQSVLGDMQVVRVEGTRVTRIPLSFDRLPSGAMNEAAARWAKIVDETAIIEARNLSTEKTKFLYVGLASAATDGKVHLQLGLDGFDLPTDDLRRMIDEGEVPDPVRAVLAGGRGGDNIIIRRSAFDSFGEDSHRFSGGGPGGPPGRPKADGYFDPKELLLSLQEKTSTDRHFFLDDNAKRAKANVEAMPKVADGTHIEILDDAKTLLPEDRALILQIRPQLTDAGIKIVQDPEKLAADNIVVITGRKTDEFTDFVSELHTQGHLTDRVVALFSCGEGTEETFNSAILGESKAPRAVLFYSERIHPNAAQEVLLALAEKLKAKHGTNESIDLQQLLHESVEAAAKKPDNAAIRMEIERMRRAIIQVSEAVPSSGMGRLSKAA